MALRVYSATSSQWRSGVKVTVVSIKGTHPDRCGTCAICRTATHLKAHSTVWI
ncbi:hypothetical protein ACTM7U_14700 [Citrobacter braakii]